MRAPEGVATYRYVGADARTVDGWESLGDMGHVDADGYLYLGDRSADMILVGGSNVYPAEVEGALDAHPLVASCCVIGLPDDDLGSRVHAIVQTTATVTDDELRAHLADLLVRYKIPRTFERVDEPLRDDAGKVRRSALRATPGSHPRRGPDASARRCERLFATLGACPPTSRPCSVAPSRPSPPTRPSSGSPSTTGRGSTSPASGCSAPTRCSTGSSSASTGARVGGGCGTACSTIPRLSRWYHAGEPLPHPGARARSAPRSTARYGVTLAGPALNYYRDGDDSVAPHADRELRVLDDTLIAIVTARRAPTVPREAEGRRTVARPRAGVGRPARHGRRHAARLDPRASRRSSHAGPRVVAVVALVTPPVSRRRVTATRA